MFIYPVAFLFEFAWQAWPRPRPRRRRRRRRRFITLTQICAGAWRSSAGANEFPTSCIYTIDIYFAPGSRGILIGSLCLYYLFMEAVIITSIFAHISITFPLPFHCSMSSVHKELIGNSFLYRTIPHTTYHIPHSIFLEPHFALSIT